MSLPGRKGDEEPSRTQKRAAPLRLTLGSALPKRRTHPAFADHDDGDDDDGSGDGAEPVPSKKPHTMRLEDCRAKAKRLTADGVTLAVDGKFGHAIARWNEAIALHPTPEVLEMKAQALLETYQYFPAIQAAEEAVRLRPGWPEALVTLGRAQLNFGELQLAQDTLQRAVACLRSDKRTDTPGRAESGGKGMENDSLLQQAEEDLRFANGLIARKQQLGQAPVDRQRAHASFAPSSSSHSATPATANPRP